MLAEAASNVFITLDMLLTAKQVRAPSSDLERLQMVILEMLSGRPSSCTLISVEISRPHGTGLQRLFGIRHDAVPLVVGDWDCRLQALSALEPFSVISLGQNIIELLRKRLLKVLEASMRS